MKRGIVLDPTKPPLSKGVDFSLPWQWLLLRNQGNPKGASEPKWPWNRLSRVQYDWPILLFPWQQ